MNDMKINRKNKQREVFVSLQNTVLIPLNIRIVYNILCKQKSQEKLKKKDIEKRDS